MTSGDEDPRPGRDPGDGPEIEAGGADGQAASTTSASADTESRAGRRQGGAPETGAGVDPHGDGGRSVGPEADDAADPDARASADSDLDASDGLGAGGATEPADADLADALRGMLSRRAELVRIGAPWRPPSAGVGRRVGPRRPGRIPVRRWALPAAAAAVVVALVVTVITIRGSGSPATDAAPGPATGATGAGPTSRSGGSLSNPADTPTPAPALAPAPAPVAQRPVPAGMQAVDALGVEIFVPKSLALDPPCDGKSVSRPAYGLTYAIGCIPTQLPVVWYSTAADVATGNDPPAQTCANSVPLGDEAGCLTVVDSDPNTDPNAVTATIIWPRHDVAVIAEFPTGQRKQAVAVAESAHWVPVDRHGCAATRSPVVPADAASLPEGSVLPADAISTSACWYSGGRLVASATLPSVGAQGLEHPGAPGNAPGIGAAPSYSPSPDGPACGELGRTDGIVFQATRPDGSIAVSAAQFADCTGGQYWTDGTHARPVDEALASAVNGLAGFLLVFGYHATPLDPETSSAAPESADDLPTTAGQDDTPVPSTPVADAPGSAGTGPSTSPFAGAGTGAAGIPGRAATTSVTTDSVTTDSVTDGSAPASDSTAAAALAQVPVPSGMQAVDALGVEIFVPKDLPLDPGACSLDSGVSRPIPHLPQGAKCAPVLRPRAVSIFVPGAEHVEVNTSSCTTFTVPLDGETACAVVTNGSGEPTTYTVGWPRHDVAISAQNPDPQVAERILRSAHWVPVDRNGCAAARSPMAVTGSDSLSASILPADATSLSVCWYLGNRLGASALLDSAAAARVIAAVNGSAPTWPPPVNRPSLTPCTTVAQHDGVLLSAHLPGGGVAQAVGTFAACNGQQMVANSTSDNSYTHIVLATADLASTIADATGLQHALTLDYPYVPD